jgi:DNA-binding transcriptional ArsR family regulator
VVIEMSRCDHETVRADLATVGRVLAARARVAMLLGLIDGSTHTAGELAQIAGVASATASQHLAVLTGSGLVAVTPDGRHRRYQIVDADVAVAIELLAGPGDLPEVTSLRLSREQRRVQQARTCYDHLAGRVGVTLLDTLIAQGWLTDTVDQVTPAGQLVLAQLGIDVGELARQRRPLLRTCIDWTERRAHLAGAVGAALTSAALNRQWVRRRPGSRGLDITDGGRQAFAALGVTL